MDKLYEWSLDNWRRPLTKWISSVMCLMFKSTVWSAMTCPTITLGFIPYRWGDQDYYTTCAGLGYDTGGEFRTTDGTGRIWLSNVRCRSQHTRLADCPHDGWGVHDCEHYEDVGVDCFNWSVKHCWFRPLACWGHM